MAMRHELSLGGEIKSDLATLIDTRLLIQANSGGGKSWCLRRVFEDPEIEDDDPDVLEDDDEDLDDDEDDLDEDVDDDDDDEW